ncbi:hypothetical protein HK414_01860 [Ramlibacter terrae]|uniref:MFS transporter n=1 Tax=Ramlibacter terrae TaxID=2732511 RepID=A0ABX6P0N9_9BURK|nr:hypothetical protein HK414_01860 [Ramlibacter terrae]
MALVCVGAVGSLLLPSHYGVLLALMLAYGMAAAIFDVAINDEATEIERQSGRPLMSGFHGMFSWAGWWARPRGACSPPRAFRRCSTRPARRSRSARWRWLPRPSCCACSATAHRAARR